jgi:hypothetical protein
MERLRWLLGECAQQVGEAGLRGIRNGILGRVSSLAREAPPIKGFIGARSGQTKQAVAEKIVGWVDRGAPMV